MNLQQPLRSNHLELKKIIQAASPTILGVDEVGRGCIAGPVCAGVVAFNPNSKLNLKKYVDSKKIKESVREELSVEIQNTHHWALGWASTEEIDRINIRQASLLAMKRALENLKLKISQGLVLVDGKDIIPNFDFYPQRSVIQGDQLVRQISAASIVAKVARDQLMKQISQAHPEYGFEKHKGYGTEEHRHAIQKYGVTTFHRKSFAGVKEYL